MKCRTGFNGNRELLVAKTDPGLLAPLFFSELLIRYGGRLPDHEEQAKQAR